MKTKNHHQNKDYASKAFYAVALAHIASSKTDFWSFH